MYNDAMDKPIKTYSLDQLPSLMKELGQPSFRTQQLVEWLYQRHAGSYNEMTNLPGALRTALSERFPLTTPIVVDRQVSKDRTRKYLIEYDDGIRVETVAIPSRNGERLTVCFSTQAGCAIGCAFCATGREGFSRNLTPGEIVDQVLIVQDDMKTRVTNVVGMGQGEPFLNYDNTMAALRILNNKKGLEIGARHISVSTCGIIPGINRFANEPEQFTLAVSLHAARQGIRDLIMPNVSRYKLTTLKEELQHYIATTNRRVTLEYIMIEGVNDADADLKALQKFCDKLLCHVNIIPINAVEGSEFQPSSRETIDYWITAIQKRGTEATLRDSRGSDISGACGQLKNTFKASI